MTWIPVRPLLDPVQVKDTLQEYGPEQTLAEGVLESKNSRPPGCSQNQDMHRVDKCRWQEGARSNMNLFVEELLDT